MTRADLRSMTVEQLVDHFADTAVAEEKAIYDATTYDDDPEREPAVKRMHVLSAELRAIDAELRARGRDARLALLRLYDHDNAQVNLQAARYTLGVASEIARQRLQVIADSRWPSQDWQARSIINALNSGNFKPD